MGLTHTKIHTSTPMKIDEAITACFEADMDLRDMPPALVPYLPISMIKKCAPYSIHKIIKKYGSPEQIADPELQLFKTCFDHPWNEPGTTHIDAPRPLKIRCHKCILEGKTVIKR